MNPSPIRANELLGRRISENKKQKPRRHKRILKNIRATEERKGPQQIIPAKEFTPKEGTTDLSVDRVDEAPLKDVAAIAERDATNEDPERIFYGWAVVSRECAAQKDCFVRASPIKYPPNPYHADIVFPGTVDDKDDRMACAQYLAENAEWIEWWRVSPCNTRAPSLTDSAMNSDFSY